jgi:GGDEF domain-containing protein
LAWQQTRGSALLGWVKDDAEYVAAQIATHPTRSPGIPKEVDAMQDRAGERDRAAHERDLVGDQRDDAGEQRDRAAHDRDDAGARRDVLGAARDEAANQRDHAAEQRDLAEAQLAGPGITINGQIRAAVARRDAASDRRAALADRRAGARARTDAEHDRDAGASERMAAEHDRDAGAIERTEAEHDRDTAHADRHAGSGKRFVTERDRGTPAPESDASSLDQLTGAYLPAAGFVELDREMARSRRTGQPLALLTVDVDELKTVDEAWGPGAADRMVVEVAGTVMSSFRPYDLVIRCRPDEFVCAIGGMSLEDATKRLASVNAVLGETHGAGWTPTTGIAELQEGDSREDVVARSAVPTDGEK